MYREKGRKEIIAKPSGQEAENSRMHMSGVRKLGAIVEVKKAYICIIITGLAAIALAFCYTIPANFVLAQVTILPGTDADDVADDSTESDDIDEEVIEEEEEETIPSSDGEVTTVPFQSLFAGTVTGNPKITQSVNHSHFIPLTNSPGDQLKVIVDYLVTDQSMVGESVNAVMEVFSVSNQSLIKISSFPNPIIANASGTIQLATTFPDGSVTDLISLVTFTDAEKEIALSEPLNLTLKLGQSSPVSS